MTKTSDDEDDDTPRSRQEIARLRDETIRNMIATPPRKHKDGIKERPPGAPGPGRPPKD